MQAHYCLLISNCLLVDSHQILFFILIFQCAISRLHQTPSPNQETKRQQQFRSSTWYTHTFKGCIIYGLALCPVCKYNTETLQQLYCYLLEVGWQVSESTIQLHSKATSKLNREIKKSRDTLCAAFTSHCSFDLICFPPSLHLESLKANEPFGVINQGELEQPSVKTKTNGKSRSFAGNISHGSKRLCRSLNSAALRLF